MQSETFHRRTLFWAIMGASVVGARGWAAATGWTALQWIVVIFMAFDLAGGVHSSTLPATAKLLHATFHPARALIFVMLHLHPFVVAATFSGFGWTAAAALWIAAVAGTVIVMRADRRHRQAFALCYCALMTMTILPLVSDRMLGWIAPLYLLKLVAAHAANEASDEH